MQKLGKHADRKLLLQRQSCPMKGLRMDGLASEEVLKTIGEGRNTNGDELRVKVSGRQAMCIDESSRGATNIIFITL